ncbi:MAG: hypothetical protein BGO57_05700 [Sphingomonadales bacterium 63-6]|nr:MAG: hypothetical protein BGO57_05700 [Sphingomonadales bacterium 63-6]
MRGIMMLPLAVLLLSACGEEPKDKRQTIDSKTVDKALAGQAIPIELEPIRLPDIEKHQLYGTSCAFAPEGGGVGAVAIAMEDAGYLKIRKEVRRFASDKGSAKLLFGTHVEHDGLANSFDLEPVGPVPEAELGSVTFPGRITVRDDHERVVYQRSGEIQCNRQ